VTGSGSGDPLVGQTLLGKLKVLRRLGAGGMGAVYEVEHTMTRHHRALKLLHAHVADNSEIVARFLREATVAGTLKTKHVVETFDAGVLDDGSTYVLMEMLEGRSLSEVFEQEKLPPARVVSLVWEACEGLEVAHRGGIVHRDLKPDNLFVARDVDGNELVKILDFGISKFSEHHEYDGTLTADGAMMGTPFYMSPEQTRGLKDIDARTDVYAAGVILYEGLGGRVPFTGESFPMLVVAIHEGKCTPLGELAPHLDPRLVAVVAKAMAKERGDRYASARDLQEALRPFADRALPERLSTTGAAALAQTVASDLPPRLSAASTPMAWTGDTKKPLPTVSRWPLFAGIALTVVGLVAGGIALTQGGEDGASEGDPDQGARGIGEEPEPVAVAEPEVVLDAGTDAGRDAGTGETPTMQRPRPGMQTMGGMSSTLTMDNVTIDTDYPGD
jgi:serine/threonine-protein kinase